MNDLPPAPQSSGSLPTAFPVKCDDYDLLEPIARGSMAELFRARQRSTPASASSIVIKRLQPHLADHEPAIRLFCAEAELTTRLHHPNIICGLERGWSNGIPYLVLEYIAGQDLGRFLRRTRELQASFPEQLAALIAMKVASALNYLHTFDGKKLIHLDVSPANILLSLAGEVKLCDFGIATSKDDTEPESWGTSRGKLPYKSPEQASRHSVDQRSDILSLTVAGHFLRFIPRRAFIIGHCVFWLDNL